MSNVTKTDGQTPASVDALAELAAQLDDERLAQLVEYARHLRAAS